MREKVVDPKEVDATIGYLAVTTPHRGVIAEHFWEKSFVIWHNKLRKKMLKGSRDESYYLLIAYHGFWFIPEFVLNFLYKRFKRNSKWEIYVFSYLLEKLLTIRGYTITQYFLITIARLKQRGLIWVVKKIFGKAIAVFTRSIKTTSSGNESIVEEVLYKRK